MTRWIILPLTLMFLALAVIGLIGAACVVLRPFPDEHDGDNEQ